jgi:GNAT superfamily N-acetyltransferase
MDELRPSGRPDPSGLRIRRIRATDQGALADFYAGLSPDSRRLRFFSAGSGLGATAASTFCHPDHAHEEGFVIVAEPSEGALAAGSIGPRIVAHLCLEPTRDGDLEMAVAVADAFQRQGLGQRLLRAATAWAREHGFRRLKATILVDNVPMLRLLEATEGRVELDTPRDGVVAATVELVRVVEGAPA